MDFKIQSTNRKLLCELLHGWNMTLCASSLKLLLFSSEWSCRVSKHDRIIYNHHRTPPPFVRRACSPSALTVSFFFLFASSSLFLPPISPLFYHYFIPLECVFLHLSQAPSIHSSLHLILYSISLISSQMWVEWWNLRHLQHDLMVNLPSAGRLTRSKGFVGGLPLLSKSLVI